MELESTGDAAFARFGGVVQAGASSAAQSEDRRTRSLEVSPLPGTSPARPGDVHQG